MTKKEFEKELNDLNPSWIISGNSIYCPLYMKPKDGYINYLEKGSPMSMNEILNDIRTNENPFLLKCMKPL